MAVKVEIADGAKVFTVSTQCGYAVRAKVSASCRFVTVYRESDGTPVATLARRLCAHCGGPAWRAYATDGAEIGDGFARVIQALKAIGRDGAVLASK